MHKGLQRQDPFLLQPRLHRRHPPPLLSLLVVQQIRIRLASQHQALRPAARLRLINPLLHSEVRPLLVVVLSPSDLSLPRPQEVQI